MKHANYVILAVVVGFGIGGVGCAHRTPDQPNATRKAADKAADDTKSVAEKTVDKTKEIAGDVATKTKDVTLATGEAITDGWITAKLKVKFVDEVLLKDSSINVDTNDRVVTLKGTVMSESGKDRAGVIARGTEGVNCVVNQLLVK